MGLANVRTAGAGLDRKTHISVVARPRDNATRAPRHLGDRLELEDHVLHLGRIDLLSTDVDLLGCPTEKAHVLAVDVDAIAGHEPSVLGERRWSIQISEHGRCRADLEHPIDDASLVTFTSDSDPEGIGGAGLGTQDPDLGQSVGLEELDLRQYLVEAEQCALRHRLGSIGHELERRQIVTLMCLREQDQVDEGR